MSDHDEEPAVTPLQSSMIQIALTSLLVVSLGALLVASEDGAGSAAATVGLVLAIAIALNVGYGALTRVATWVARALVASD